MTIPPMALTTPALLFPAISLLLLAYTNRFVVLANVIRQLSALEREDLQDLVVRQVANLRKRLGIIKAMQGFGVTAFLLCTVSMFCLFLGWMIPGEIAFAVALILLAISLILSLWEVRISTDAIMVELERLDRQHTD